MGLMRQAVQIKRQKWTRPILASYILTAAGLVLALPAPALAQVQPSQAVATATQPTYTALADLTLRSEVVLTANLRKMERLSAKEAPDVPAGYMRFLVRANVTSVLLAPRAVPLEITYLWDAPVPPSGKKPDLKGESVLLFLRTVPGNDRIYQLATANGQVPASPTAIETTRAIAADPIRPFGFGFRITGVVEATRLQRHSEESFATHFLIQTAERGFLTVSVPEASTGSRTIQVELPDSLGDGKPLKRESLIGFFLSCGLPPSLPKDVLATADATGDTQAINADYQLLRREVGPCR